MKRIPPSSKLRQEVEDVFRKTCNYSAGQLTATDPSASLRTRFTENTMSDRDRVRDSKGSGLCLNSLSPVYPVILSGDALVAPLTLYL